MEIIILEAYRIENNQFKLIFEEKPKSEDVGPLKFTRTRINPVTHEPKTEIFYLHHFDREGIRYLIYFNDDLNGIELELNALEKALDKYILESKNLNVVKNLIDGKCYTVSGLAASVDVDISVIERFVTSGELPKGTHGLKLAEVLNISIDELITVSNQRQSDYKKEANTK